MALWDVVDQPLAVEPHRKILMRNDAGEVVARASHSVPIRPAATFGPTSFSPGYFDPELRQRSLDQDYFDVGSSPAGFMLFGLNVHARSAAGWKVRSSGQALDASAAVLDFYGDGDVVTSVSPGNHLYSVDLARRGILPEGSRRLRNFMDLVTPGGVRVASITTYVNVRSIFAEQTKPVPAGASLVGIDPVDVVLNFSGNRQAGTVKAAEFGERFPEPGVSQLVASKTADFKASRFVPINRYWAPHGDLQEGAFTAEATFAYDPATDFPTDAAFREDSLVIAGFNPLSGTLEVLPTVLDKASRTVTTGYSTFFETYVVVSRSTVVVQTAAEEAPVEVPERYAIEPNYPNPFNSSTMFTLAVARSQRVRIEVYDVVGRRVPQLHDGHVAAGARRTFAFEAGSLTSGLYLLRIAGEAFQATQTMTLLK